jgi:2-polyprenyl-3-methyl-5-hydroxy-6-metoxy-1,4-benzoquinol methylase
MAKRAQPEPTAFSRRVLDHYRGLPWGKAFFLWVRWHWTPYQEMADLMPRSGSILDAGCGHGLFSLALALGSPSRKVLGIDHAFPRLAQALKASEGVPNVDFRYNDYPVLPGGPYAGIALIDVLHYLPFQRQELVLKKAFRKLRRGGVLLFREVDQSPGLASAYNRLHERFMTGLGFTQAAGLHFRDPKGWEAIAVRAGFQVTARPLSRFPFADILFVGRKP